MNVVSTLVRKFKQQSLLAMLVEAAAALLLFYIFVGPVIGWLRLFWCVPLAVAAGLFFAHRRWPKVRLRHYLSSRKSALPAVCAVGGWGAQYVVTGVVPVLANAIGEGYVITTAANMLVGGLVAAACAGVAIAIFDGKLMRDAFDAVPPDRRAQSAGPAAPTQQRAQQPTAPGFQYSAMAPTTTFADLHGHAELKAALLDDAGRWRAGQGKGRAAGKNGILLFGPPGTGKTAFIEALAGELGVGLIKVSVGQLTSRWIGQSTEMLNKLFADAVAQQPCVLFIDEIDAVLKSRDQLAGQPEEYSRIVDTFLERAEAVRGRGVLLVAATNYVDKLDSAAIREGRFDFHHEVPLPDAAAREGLLRQGMAKAHCTTDDATMARLVRRWAGFNVPRLLACAAGASEVGRTRQGRSAQPSEGEPEAAPVLTYADYYRALRKLQGRRGGAPEGAKALDELFMDPDLHEALQTLATQLTQVDEVETLGGTLPKGVLFCGPPGTGKTATAMALARECGWSFIARTGRQLLADGAVAKLQQEASDLRPAIVFIDEADDILGDRNTSPYKAATNELLTAIDGAKGMLCDVVWVAATNHPESMDGAALRGGRFGRRIEFRAPGRETVERLIGDWLRRKLAERAVVIDGDEKAWTAGAADALTGMVPADIYHTLEEANNVAVVGKVRGAGDRVLTVDRVAESARTVQAQRGDVL